VELHNRPKSCCPRGEKEYRVMDGAGNILLSGKEELDCCCRSCRCICRRDFDIRVEDGKHNPVIDMNHAFMCCSYFTCCCSLCRHRLTVKERKGKHLGAVRSDCTTCCSCFPSYSVFDEKDKTEFVVKKEVDCMAQMCGGCYCCCCQANIPAGFAIKGKAKGNGEVQHMTSRGRAEDTYRVIFPRDSDEMDRLMLIAACFMVDYAQYDGAKPGVAPMV